MGKEIKTKVSNIRFLILSEFLTILKVLSTGGHFVLKLFDTTSPFTLSLLYICCHIFDNTYIIKPFRSRRVNSERQVAFSTFLTFHRRYLVGKSRKPNTQKILYLIDLLGTLQKRTTIFESPCCLLASQVVERDEKFIESMQEMCKVLNQHQEEALETIINKVCLECNQDTQATM